MNMLIILKYELLTVEADMDFNIDGSNKGLSFFEIISDFILILYSPFDFSSESKLIRG